MAGRSGDAAGTARGLSPPITVLVVDDHEVALWGFQHLLEEIPWVENIHTAKSPAEGLEIATRILPHVAIIDLYLGRDSGLNLCRQIRDASPETRILLISGAAHVSEGVARAAGAAGFVGKEWSSTELSHAIRIVARGGKVFADAPQQQSPRADLSERELDVLRCLGAGLSNREIAAELHLSVYTVKEYMARVFRKLRARNRADAVARAQRLGLVD